MAPIARYPITLERYIGTGSDDYGNEIETWADGEVLFIYGINFPKSSEPVREGGHNRLVIDKVMLVPPTFVCGDKDRVVLPGETQKYQVEGIPGEADRNPFGWNPGGTVNIRRVDG